MHDGVDDTGVMPPIPARLVLRGEPDKSTAPPADAGRAVERGILRSTTAKVPRPANDQLRLILPRCSIGSQGGRDESRRPCR